MASRLIRIKATPAGGQISQCRHEVGRGTKGTGGKKGKKDNKNKGNPGRGT